MPLSMYRASVPIFVRALEILSGLLDKGAAHAGADAQTLVEARLAPDMLTLAGQVQRASDTAKFAVVRLTGGEGPSFADDETTIEQLKARCAATVAFLVTARPEAFEGSESRAITFGREPVTLSGENYLLGFALPNFFFHITTAYDILRHVGVPVGKRDYLGPWQ